jgi:hypothetical protein
VSGEERRNPIRISRHFQFVGCQRLAVAEAHSCEAANCSCDVPESPDDGCDGDGVGSGPAAAVTVEDPPALVVRSQ